MSADEKKRAAAWQAMVLMARLNGVLQGALAGESFTLSQSFYIGAVDGHEYKVKHIKGQFIDLMPELDANAIGKRPASPQHTGNGAAMPEVHPHGEVVPEAVYMAQIIRGEHYHNPMLSLSSKWSHQGIAPQEQSERLHDLFDVADDRGDAEEHRKEIERTVRSAWEKYKPKPIVTPATILIDVEDDDEPLTHMPGLIRGVIPGDALVMYWGEPGAFKSFTAQGQAFAIATNTPWLKRPVKPGRVWYFAGEGRAGMRKRIRAWRKKTGITAPLDMKYTPRSILLDSEDGKQSPAMQALLASLEDDVLPKVIVVDTLARSMAGDESATKDMSRYIAAIDELVAAVRRKGGLPTVIIIHHSRKDGLIYRGNTALRAAIDVEYEIRKTSKLRATMVCLKYKDDELPKPLHLKATIEHLGIVDDDFGIPTPLTSLVMEEIDEAERKDAESSEETKKHGEMLDATLKVLAKQSLSRNMLKQRLRESKVAVSNDTFPVFVGWAIERGFIKTVGDKLTKGEANDHSGGVETCPTDPILKDSDRSDWLRAQKRPL